jgi:hypothetical protein
MEATMSNDSPLSEARTDFYTVVHKALRKQLFEAIMVAGSTDYGDSDDRTRVARAVAEVVKRFRDHADHEEQFLHPVIAEVLPATEQALHAQHEEHSRGLDEVERAFEMALADRTGASGHRAYRALSRFAGHSLAHMEEEEAGQARLWELAGETRLAAAMAAFKRSRTFERVAGPKCVGRPRDAETAAVTYNVLGASVVTATANQFGDLHVGFKANRAALGSLGDHRDDWLALAGDLGERLEDVELVLRVTVKRFARVLYTPGNHEPWAMPGESLRGLAKYNAIVKLCRSYGVLTPEDDYPVWRDGRTVCVIAPLFLLYDYSFRPEAVAREDTVAWAAETGAVSGDEALLDAHPFDTREAWCHARCESTHARLSAIDPAFRTVLVNHFPLRYEHAQLPRVPRFTPWCGTRRTEDWHRRFRALVVVGGHLHIPSTRWLEGVRFEEVSVGYPRQWHPEGGLERRLREVLPGTA